MNKKFSYAIDKKNSLMKENSYTEEELKLIISERKDKIIDNASSISYNYNYYIPINPETGEVICFSKGIKCTLIINYDGEYWCEIENHYYQLIELKNPDCVMKKESEIKQNKKEHHKYIPPKSHPWRKKYDAPLLMGLCPKPQDLLLEVFKKRYILFLHDIT